jgi:hypothetical protein
MLEQKIRPPSTEMMIGGNRVQAVGGATIDVEDPAGGTIFAQVPASDAEAIDRAVAAARATPVSKPWPGMRPLDRSKLIEKLAIAIEDKAEELALLDSHDNGMPVAVAKAFVQFSADNFRYTAGWPTKLTGAVNPISADRQSYHCYSQSVPVGVFGKIVPCNAPLVSPRSRSRLRAVRSCSSRPRCRRSQRSASRARVRCRVPGRGAQRRHGLRNDHRGSGALRSWRGGQDHLHRIDRGRQGEPALAISSGRCSIARSIC